MATLGKLAAGRSCGLTLALCVALLLPQAGGAAAEPWAGKITPLTKGTFPDIPPFTGEFRFGWSDIEAARATATLERKGDKYIVDVSGGTTGLARTLWSLDATHHAEFYADTFRPTVFDQVEKYAKRTITTRGEFRPDGFWRHRESKPGKPEKWKKIKIEPIWDMVAGMFFVRSQRLADGDKVVINLYPGDSAFFTEITVLKREKITIDGKAHDAIKLEFKPQRITRKDGKFGLEPHGKFKRGVVWLSDDKYRMPLRAEVDIFIGYVFGELANVRFQDGSTLP